jgi:hypothetical protein
VAAAAGAAEEALKLAAVDCYPTQWRLFYGALEEWRAALSAYSRAMGAPGVVERVWRMA